MYLFNFSVVNFSATHEGLEEQLLSDVVMHEMPELENQMCEPIILIAYPHFKGLEANFELNGPDSSLIIHFQGQHS